ncbi:hypothetical protein P692DRAFT_201858104 [Suillus brevipes Sb2]|nr:hypothetical protein P692DRAFT_201858104 [Suillus brevipes Sb2]
MPEPQEHWCNCQYYCHGVRTKLGSRATWFRHLQRAPNEEERAAIRAAGLSDTFRTTSAGPAGPSSTRDNDSDEERPQKRAREDNDELPLADNDDIVDHTIDALHEHVYEPPDSPLPDRDPQNEPENPRQDPLQDVRQRSPPPDVDGDAEEIPWHNPLNDLDVDDLFRSARLPNLQRDMSFICSLRSATLDDGVGLKGEDLQRLQNPPRFPCQIDNPCEELAISLFLALQHSSEVAYDNIRNAVQKRYPDSEVPTFVGPYAGLETCPTCGELRYDQKKLARSHGRKKVPRAVFQTIPIGPQLQALWRERGSAQHMSYRNERTQQIFEEIRQNEGYVDAYEDILTGSAYLDAVRQGRIKPEDMVLMISIDGAQLFESKMSDCWVYIWIIVDHSPDRRYKKQHVLPGGVIPGPNKPKYIQSFLYPGFHHLAAIQREGLSIWDAWRDVVFISHPFLFLALADGPGLICMSSLVGHTGKNGCRMYCGLQGRRKPHASQYYPVLLKPNNYTVVGCTHEDIDVRDLTSGTSALYVRNLRTLMASQNQAQYERNRLMTGIVGPSILLGLDVDHILGVPECFSSEIMHFSGANMASLFTDLWCGVADCHAVTDSVADWDWAVLVRDTWEAHGKAVAATHTHLPGSFDVPPRNPAEKMHSFYKAREFITWLFGIGPGLLYGILPPMYFQHYCKFVRGLRIMSQYRITTAEMLEACICFSEWEEEFERIYYQRRVDRIHFVRPCVHLANHLAAEGTRVGAPCCSSQWTLERTIGDIEFDLRQPSNAMSNFTEICVTRCRVNALKAMLPQFQTSDALHPRGSFDVGNGYVLLRARDRKPRRMPTAQATLISNFLGRPAPPIRRWSRLRLPHGQIARSAWKETESSAEFIRISRNVKFHRNDVDEFAEVLYFTQMITAVVAMIPHRPTLPSGVTEDRYFMVEKTGLDVTLTGVEVEEDDQEEQEDQ